MATSSTYCTHRDLEDIFPNVNDYDSKEAIYGWKVLSGDKYVADNTGVITKLFMDGEHLGAAQSSSGAVDGNYDWHYSSTWDRLYFYNSSLFCENPNDLD